MRHLDTYSNFYQVIVWKTVKVAIVVHRDFRHGHDACGHVTQVPSDVSLNWARLALGSLKSDMIILFRVH